MFTSQIIVRLHHTDAAGVLFFAHQFTLAHDIYEQFMESIGCSLSGILAEGETFLLIVHTEADYATPLRAGDRLQVELRVTALTEHSFTLGYRFTRANGKEVGLVQTVHVAVNKQTGEKTSLWPQLRQALQAHR